MTDPEALIHCCGQRRGAPFYRIIKSGLYLALPLPYAPEQRDRWVVAAREARTFTKGRALAAARRINRGIT